MIVENVYDEKKTSLSTFIELILEFSNIESLSMFENQKSSNKHIARVVISRKTFKKQIVVNRKISTIIESKTRKKRSISKQSSRVNFIILFSKNDNNNQTHFFLSNSIKNFNKITKTKKIAIQKLNILARRYYITFLTNKKTNEFIMIVFSKIKSTYIVYKILRIRCFKFYKQ